MSDSSRPHGLQPTRFLHPWDFPGKNTGVGCHCLPREIHYVYVFTNLVSFKAFFQFSSSVNTAAAAAAAESLQSCPTLRDPIDVSPRGSPAPGILQARKLEWVAISFSNV